MSKQPSFTPILLLLSLLAMLSLTGCSPQEKSNIVQWQGDKECDLHTNICIVKNGSASVTLKISPNPIPIARPLKVEALIENIEAEKVELDISGVNMYMGYNRVQLKPRTSTDKKTLYKGSSMLAFCTLQEMTWQITVMIHQADGTQIQIPHTLITVNQL